MVQHAGMGVGMVSALPATNGTVCSSRDSACSAQTDEVLSLALLFIASG